MKKNETNCHISQQFNEDLERVCGKVSDMGMLVKGQIGNAVAAVVSGNMELAESVVSHELFVNSLESSIDEISIQLLARRQPTAKDLRLIVAVIKTITDLERIGDQAVNIARAATHSSEMKWPNNLYSEVQRFSDRVISILHNALQIFSSMDADAAERFLQKDMVIDDDYKNIVRQMLDLLMNNPRYVSRTLDIIWSARALERIEDHSRNICENVIYFVNGKDVRHSAASDMTSGSQEGNSD